MIDKFKKIYKSKYFPFIVLFFIMLLLHIFMKPDLVDDYHFKKALDNKTLLEWLNFRYNSWSSRLIIEALLLGILAINFFLWKIINSLVVVLLAYSVSKLLVKDNFRKNNWLIVIFLLMLPIEMLSSAGWITSSLNYLWPLTFSVYSLISIKKELANEKISIFNYILYTLGIIYATNQEQVAIAVFAIYLIYFIYSLIKKRFSLFSLIIILISLISIIYIITCPGNYARFNIDIAGHYADYNMLSFIDKCVLGITSTMAHFILRHTILFGIISSLIAFVVYKKYKKILYRIIGFFPVVACILFSIICNIVFMIDFMDGDFLNHYARVFLLNADNFYNPLSYIPLILYMLILGTFVISLYLIFKHTYKSVLSILIFIIGLGTRLIMGFSPSVFVSSYRPDLFMAFGLVVIGFLVFNEIKNKSENRKECFKVILWVSILSYILNVIHAITYSY